MAKLWGRNSAQVRTKRATRQREFNRRASRCAALAQLLNVGQKTDLLPLMNSTVFFRTTLAPAQCHALRTVGAMCRLEQYAHFLLAFIARRRLTEDLSPTFLLFKLLMIADPFLLSCGHQPVTARFPDTRQVLTLQFTRRRFQNALVYGSTI